MPEAKPLLKVDTLGGSSYFISTEYGWWRKNEGSWERIWWAHGVSPETDTLIAARDAKQLPIEVGNLLYIGSRDIWWLSTVIEKVSTVLEEF